MSDAMRIVWRAVACLAIVLSTGISSGAAPWYPLGPFGGDARSFAVSPKDSQHLFLGTATGWIYESLDGGKEWKRLSMVARDNTMVIDHILVDPLNAKHLTMGGWVIDRPDGGLYESMDGGKTWAGQAEMRGQSVRALAAAPSDPKILVAGSLKGVYRSEDSGVHWKLISPEGNTEIHEIESIAIDPADPNIIYAGTWHLPWKTLDGGKTWSSIKDGILDDSDVFSIVIDVQSPKNVYLSACSGIYKSVNAGLHFDRVRKDQLGMDHAALRTRKLQQDQLHPQIVFAGTTQGLWRTTDNAATWSRLTAADVIVNDVFIDPKNSNHMLLATDRAGVLLSEDGGVTFAPSNTGFSARQVTAFATDPRRASTIYVGVVNDKTAGGVFMSEDGGVRWQQQSNALNGRDVFSLGATKDGVLLAGTAHGIFRLDAGAWAQSGTLVLPPPVDETKPVVVKKAVPTKAGVKAGVSKAIAKPAVPPPPPFVDATVFAIVPVGDAIYAGTAQGLLKGSVDGTSWKDVSTLQMPETRYVAAMKSIVMVANMRRIAVSMDDGNRWDSVSLPQDLTQISSIAIDELGNLWVGGREGVYYSTDYGASWKTLRNMYVTVVTGIYFDPVGHRVMVTTENGTTSFSAHLPDYKVSYWDSGWTLRFVRPAGDHMVGATLYDGIVVQPVMVDSKVAEK